MKKILLIIVSILLIIGTSSQIEKKFNYKSNRPGFIDVTPRFDQSKGTGKFGVASFSDPSYLTKVFDKVKQKVLTKDKVDSLLAAPMYKVFFNTTGEFINCVFTVHNKDLDVISDNDFYELYLGFKNTKFDTSKFKIVGPDELPQAEKYDFTIIMGTLIPNEFWQEFQNRKFK